MFERFQTDTLTAEAAAGTDRAAGSTLRKRLLLALKLVVTVGLSAWIVTLVDWSQFWAVLIASKLWVVGLVVLMRFGGLAISSFKWQQLLTIHGLQYRLRRLLSWYLVATFLNHFLPTSIGGDGYRIYRTWNNERGRSSALMAIFVERTSGLAALMLLGWAAAIVTALRKGDPLAEAITLAGAAGLLIAAGFLLLVIRFRLPQALIRSRFWPERLTGLLGLVSDFRSHPGKGALIAVISLVFHINKITVIWLLLYALGASTSILELAVAVLVVEVVGLLPISLGGLGLIEGSFIYVMGHFGVSQEIGLATMLLMRVLMVPFSLVGAALYFIGDRDVRRSDSLGRESTRVSVDTAHAK